MKGSRRGRRADPRSGRAMDRNSDCDARNYLTSVSLLVGVTCVAFDSSEARVVSTAVLIEKLITAAAEAIQNERPSLDHDPGRVRGVVLDLAIGPGQSISGSCYVEKRLKLGARSSND